ncbi:FecR family protein [Chondrinema litorale]|uniref:FecR family protein n=1 Tax=Chondrinema litorale TaxID=2994555 RepID=UPI002543B987|nr:FecR family protein [Chondrinema litorale]UZR99173.1 FecR domain-containing protein [Chondrinema litorale]
MKTNDPLSDLEKKELLRKYLSNTCSAQELELVFLILENVDDKHFLEEVAEELWQKGDKEIKLEAAHKEALKQGILRKIPESSRRKETKQLDLSNSFQAYYKVAALVILTVGLGLAYLKVDKKQSTNKQIQREAQWITKYTHAGEKLTVKLPDSTIVKLNAESSIAYRTDFNDSIRFIKIAGEAFFNVSHNKQKPFLVETDKITTRVLGTSFTVKSFADEATKVTVLTGKVGVAVNSGNTYFEAPKDIKNQAIVLLPSQQAVLVSDSILELKEINLDIETGWKDGNIRFDKTDLLTVKKVLERWYGISIQLNVQSPEKCLISSEYKNESLENILQSIGYILQLKYQFIDKKTIEITGNGC